MEIFIFLVGSIIGGATVAFYMYKHTMHGIVEVDHKKQLCNAILPDGELTDRKLKRVVLKVIHDVDIPVDDEN